jgi:hypothetical protein
MKKLIRPLITAMAASALLVAATAIPSVASATTGHAQTAIAKQIPVAKTSILTADNASLSVGEQCIEGGLVGYVAVGYENVPSCAGYTVTNVQSFADDEDWGNATPLPTGWLAVETSAVETAQVSQ